MLHCAGFIPADSFYMFRASGAHHQEYLKIGTAATGTCVTVAGRSSHHHIRDKTECVFGRVTLIQIRPLHGDVMTYLQP